MPEGVEQRVLGRPPSHKMRTLWRRRVEVESTIRPAKDRIAGFEGRGSHRTPFASEGSIAGHEKVDLAGYASDRLGDFSGLARGI
jgi:hypothetical protein